MTTSTAAVSKPRAALRQASPPPIAATIDESASPAPRSTVSVTLDELHLSDDNVRHNTADPQVDSLAASILSVGLIQPMVITPRRDGRKKITGYNVVAGRRRFRALLQLAEQQPERSAWMFECVLVDDVSKLTEISLAENYAREQMRPAEIYQAFAKIRAERPNATLEELGAMFSFDRTRTARIMRLANLAPEIMDLYAAGKIDDNQAQAYAATEDQALQVEVYQQLEKQARYPHEKTAAAIRKAMASGNSDLSKLLRYVGVDAYREAGGVFEQDLFSSSETAGRILNPELLQTLAGRKRIADKDAFEHALERSGRRLGEKWGLHDLQFSWAGEPPKITQYGYASTDRDLEIKTLKRGKLSAAEEALHASLTASLEQAKALEEPEDETAAREYHDRIEQLLDEIDEIDRRRTYLLPKKGAVVGIVEISDDGIFDVDLYYANRAEKGIATPAGVKEKAATKAEPTPAERDRARWGLTKDGMQAMLLLRRDMIREQLFLTASAGSTIAIEFLVYSQARTIVRPAGETWDKRPYIKGDPVGIATPASQDESGSKPPSSVRKIFDTLSAGPNYHAALKSLGAQDWAQAEDPIDGFMQYRMADPAVKDQAAAIVAAHGLMASTTFYSDGRTPRMVNELANYLESEEGAAPWYDTVTYDEAFFEAMNHKVRVGLLNEWGLLDHAKIVKKADSAALCARVIRAVNGDDREIGALGIQDIDVGDIQCWRPEYLDTQITDALSAGGDA